MRSTRAPGPFLKSGVKKKYPFPGCESSGAVRKARGMNLSWEQWIGLLTAGAAWLGLGLSLYNLYQSRPKQRVEASLGFVHSLIGSPRRVVVIRFINERGPAVVIEEAGFQCADRSLAVVPIPGPHAARLPSDRLPTTVPPGHSAKYYYDWEEWRSNVKAGDPVPVSAYCRDATGRYHKSRKLSEKIRSALSR